MRVGGKVTGKSGVERLYREGRKIELRSREHATKVVEGTEKIS